MKLGPGGRIVLVLAGLFLVYLGLDRAGWLPGFAPSILGPRVAQPPPGPQASNFAFEAGAACVLPLRIASAPRVAAARTGPQVEVEAMATARQALERLASGAVSGAVVSVSELAAHRDVVADAPPAVGVALAGTPADLVVLAERAATVADLAGGRVAAVPGSAEEYRLLGALAQGGVLERVELVAAATPEDAVARMHRGEVGAAAAPLQYVAQAARVGRGRIVRLAAPLDPVLLVLAPAAATCASDERVVGAAVDPDRARAIFPDPGLSLADALAQDLPRASAAELQVAFEAAARVRGGPRVPPFVLVVPGGP